MDNAETKAKRHSAKAIKSLCCPHWFHLLHECPFPVSGIVLAVVAPVDELATQSIFNERVFFWNDLHCEIGVSVRLV